MGKSDIGKVAFQVIQKYHSAVLGPDKKIETTLKCGNRQIKMTIYAEPEAFQVNLEGYLVILKIEDQSLDTQTTVEVVGDLAKAIAHKEIQLVECSLLGLKAYTLATNVAATAKHYTLYQNLKDVLVTKLALRRKLMGNLEFDD
jgi:hypothetical protein